MYHFIEFNTLFTADVEISPRQRLERMQIKKGTQARIQLRPYVLESDMGPVEVADLCFEDGTVTRGVPYAYFRMLD